MLLFPLKRQMEDYGEGDPFLWIKLSSVSLKMASDHNGSHVSQTVTAIFKRLDKNL